MADPSITNIQSAFQTSFLTSTAQELCNYKKVRNPQDVFHAGNGFEGWVVFLETPETFLELFWTPRPEGPGDSFGDSFKAWDSEPEWPGDSCKGQEEFQLKGNFLNIALQASWWTWYDMISSSNPTNTGSLRKGSQPFLSQSVAK